MAIALAYLAPGTIGSYPDLVDKVALWLDRVDLEPRVPDFIALAEARFNRLLRTPEMESGFIVAQAGETTALPIDFLELRGAYLEGDTERPLLGMSPGALPLSFSGQARAPLAYSLVGNALRLAPPPREPVMLAISYWAKLLPLSEGEKTNWLLERHPDIYLYGALVQAEAFLDNPERVSLWKGALDEALSELVVSSNKARWGGGPLVPNTVPQVRGARC